MIYEEINSESRARRTLTGAARILSALKIDGPLVTGLALISAYGLIVLYSASGQSVPTIIRTIMRIILGAAAMLVLARVNPNFLRRTTPWLYVIGVFLLVVVAAFGHIGLGAQRWLSLGIIRFQPSELMKLAVPMMCAWYLHERALPPSFGSLLLLAGLILVPVGLVAVEPDLGTAALIGVAGVLVIIMAGLQVRIMGALLALGAAAAWLGWGFTFCPEILPGMRSSCSTCWAFRPRTRWGCCLPSLWRPRKPRRPMTLTSTGSWTVCFSCCHHSGRCFSSLRESSCCGTLSRIKLRNYRPLTGISRINIFRIKMLDVDFAAPRSTLR